jgi:hypothetical protein
MQYVSTTLAAKARTKHNITIQAVRNTPYVIGDVQSELSVAVTVRSPSGDISGACVCATAKDLQYYVSGLRAAKLVCKSVTNKLLLQTFNNATQQTAQAAAQRIQQAFEDN